MNLEILKIIQSFNSPVLDNLFQIITVLGEEGFAIIFSAIVFWCYDRKAGYRLFFAYVTGTCINEGLKNAFQTLRPVGQAGIRSLRLETASGYSFPSGHTQSITTIMASVMKQTRKRRLYPLGAIIVLLVGYSRLYLGVHWPIDVLGGIAVGVIWVYISDCIIDFLSKAGRLVLVAAVSLPLAAGYFLIGNENYFKLAGAVLGLVIGFSIENSCIHFKSRANMKIQLLKCMLGLSGIFALKTGLKALLPLSHASNVLRYALIAVWAIAGIPFIFQKLQRSINTTVQ